VTSLHIPIRPHWLCAGCNEPWPCPTKRAQFLAEYDGAHVSLSLLMSLYFVDAAADIPAIPCAEAYKRFLGWMPRRPTGRYTAGPFTPISKEAGNDDAAPR
jgi:hypothetical protein